jgi:hypothetical protein
MSWFRRAFGHIDPPQTLNINEDLLRRSSELEDAQKIQTALVRLQGRELRQEMINTALDIRQRRER